MMAVRERVRGQARGGGIRRGCRLSQGEVPCQLRRTGTAWRAGPGPRAVGKPVPLLARRIRTAIAGRTGEVRKPHGSGDGAGIEATDFGGNGAESGWGAQLPYGSGTELWDGTESTVGTEAVTSTESNTGTESLTGTEPSYASGADESFQMAGDFSIGSELSHTTAGRRRCRPDRVRRDRQGRLPGRVGRGRRGGGRRAGVRGAVPRRRGRHGHRHHDPRAKRLPGPRRLCLR